MTQSDPGGGSEIARIRAMIAMEYRAGQTALSEFAAGAGRHAFITRRMENIGKHAARIKEITGSEVEAAKIVAAALDNADAGAESAARPC